MEILLCQICNVRPMVKTMRRSAITLLNCTECRKQRRNFNSNKPKISIWFSFPKQAHLSQLFSDLRPVLEEMPEEQFNLFKWVDTIPGVVL